MSTFRNINFPTTFKYSSDSENIPLEFYNDTFPVAKKIDLFLGYFSSNAIKVLSKSFAEFVVNGGEMRIITNHVYSLKDKENLIDQNLLQNEDKIIDILNDLEKLEFELSDYGQHFFDCLKYLQKNKRLIIQPVKFNNIDLAHCKKMILYDGNDYISTDGSINFTLSALTKNSESFEVNAPWKGDIFKERVDSEIAIFEKVISGNHSDYKHISSDNIEIVINNYGNEKDKQDLLEDSLKIDNSSFGYKVKRIINKKKERFQKKLKLISSTPKFPYDEPYPYQKKAYKAWIENDYKGLLAMATGTGKTLTSLYCLIEEFKKNNVQKNIFVVPTEELVRQWAEELRDCNFSHIFLWYGSVSSLKKSLNDIKILKRGKTINIIVTYISLKSETFQKIFKDSFKEFTVVFDEVHNLGAQGVRKALKGIEFKRTIGLSATPLRLWDDNGENIFIEEMFKSYHPDYTFSFPMEKAIGKFLVNYNYYPFFINLNNDEWERYLKYTSQIPFGDSENSINTTAALKRQLLLDQAEAKKDVLIDIIGKLVEDEKYRRTLVYCPKGRHDREDEDRIIKNLQSSVSDKFQNLNIQLFVGATKDRKELLQDFENDEVDMLFSIKVLDEGVNVPMAENAIFLASGKNYREFVQRRGRVLRKYKNSVYEKTHANIYDIVVLPSLDQYNSHRNTAKKLIVAEFKRLFEFFNMSYRDNDVFWKIEQELEKYNLSQYHIDKIIKDEE